MDREVATAAEEQVPFSDPDLDSLAFADSPDTAPEPAGDSDAATGESQQQNPPAAPKQKADPAASAQPAPTQPATPPQIFKIRGKDGQYRELTAAQIAADPGLLNDLTQSHEQLPHLTRKQQELVQQLNSMRQPPPGQPGQGGQPTVQPGALGIGGLSPEQVTAALRPTVDKAVADGWIDKEFAEYFPTFAGQAVLHRDLIYDVRAAVKDILDWRAGLETQNHTQGNQQAWDSALDRLGAEGDVFGPLADKSNPAARDGFTQFVRALNPSMEQALDPAFMRRQWIAFNSEAIMESLKHSGAESAERVKRKRGNATGEGSSGRLSDAQPETAFGEDLLPDGYRFARKT